jgi:putative FmdB family regulatory protein
MPLYEYQCDVCATRFERIQKFSDPPVETCPSCEGAVRKLVSSPAIQFKGSGWYITDYARKPEAAKDTGDTAKEKAGKEGKDAADKSGASGSGESSSTSSTTDSASAASNASKTTSASSRDASSGS